MRNDFTPADPPAANLLVEIAAMAAYESMVRERKESFTARGEPLEPQSSWAGLTEQDRDTWRNDVRHMAVDEYHQEFRPDF